MYARRQRRVQSAGTNARFTGIMPNPDVIPDRTPQPDMLYQVWLPYHWVPFSRPCQGGGAATRLTADQLHSGSNPDLGFDRSSLRTTGQGIGDADFRPRAGNHKIGCPWRESTKLILDQSSVVIAAIAVGKHLDPFRTQQLSRLTWCAVLRYASPWEPHLAAITFLLTGFFSGYCHRL
jgi:hypothetical protein